MEDAEGFQVVVYFHRTAAGEKNSKNVDCPVHSLCEPGLLTHKDGLNIALGVHYWNTSFASGFCISTVARKAHNILGVPAQS